MIKQSIQVALIATLLTGVCSNSAIALSRRDVASTPAMSCPSALAGREQTSLRDDNIREVLHYRRFPSEWPAYRKSHSHTIANASKSGKWGDPSLVKKLVGTVFNAIVREVRPSKTDIAIKSGVKLGIVLGYHHLEKPWGRIFKEMFIKQVSFNRDQIVFIEIANDEVSTGLHSDQSEQEIEMAIQTQGLTHIFDIHEFFSESDYYSEHAFMREFARFRPRQYGTSQVGYSMVDAWVPVWIMEKYFLESRVVPLLQYAMNRHILLLKEGLEEANLLTHTVDSK